MGINQIIGDNLYLNSAYIQLNSTQTHFELVIADEYFKSLQFQKVLRKNKKFYISGDLLFGLLCELLDHINNIFLKIRLNDVNIEEENKTLLFLKKFSRSSASIKDKLSQKQHSSVSQEEVFEFHITGLEKSLSFVKDSQGNSKMLISIPANYTYSRLISFLDQMEFSELSGINGDVRILFLNRIKELVQNVEDKKQQINMRYALELATDRIRSLESENQRLQLKIHSLIIQNDLYKRSYMSLKNRQSINNKSSQNESLEEL